MLSKLGRLSQTLGQSVLSGVWSFFLLFLGGQKLMIIYISSYMLRYLKAVQMMKQILDENNLQVMSTIARYACAYESIAKLDWWDKAKRLV